MGAALWRHAGAITASAKEAVEVLALDPMGRGRRLAFRDQWNVPAAGSKFRVRRILTGGRASSFNEIDCARLEGLVLDWVRERRPRLVHVLELEPFGPGLLLALQAADVPVILTMQRLDGLRVGSELATPDSDYWVALQSVHRIVVRSAEDAAIAEAAGAPRERIRVMPKGRDGEVAILRAYSSLYRMLLAPAADASA